MSRSIADPVIPVPPAWRQTWRLLLFAVISVMATIGYLVVVGIPTAMIPNPVFIRMLPATPSNYVFWVVPALLFGPLLATYVVPLRPPACSVQGRTTTAGFLSFLAVGCPICNKVVVLLLGVSGALAYFQPIQPLLGVISIGLLVFALWLRLSLHPARAAKPGT